MKNAKSAPKTRKPRKGLELKPNCRGFAYGEFKDANGELCSLQESSAQPHSRSDGWMIWLGVFNPKGDFQIQPQTPEQQSRYGFGWKQKNLSEMYPDCWVNVPDRMHLSQKQVKALLPALQHFAKTGRLLS